MNRHWATSATAVFALALGLIVAPIGARADDDVIPVAPEPIVAIAPEPVMSATSTITPVEELVAFEQVPEDSQVGASESAPEESVEMVALTSTNPVWALNPEVPMMGLPTTSDDIGYENAVCVTQLAGDLSRAENDFPVYPAELTVELPPNEYLVLDFTLPITWDLVHYYSYYYNYFTAEVRISYPASTATEGLSSTSATANIVGDYVSPPDQPWLYNLASFSSRIIVAPEGTTVSGYPGVPVINVLSNTPTALDLGIGVLGVPDLGQTGGELRPTELTVSGQLYDAGGTEVGGPEADTTGVPAFVRQERDGVWKTYANCAAIPYPPRGTPEAEFPATNSLPHLSKAYEPTLIQPGGTSKLTFTLLNTPDLSATGNWSFTDVLPHALIDGSNANSNIQMIVAEVPNWSTDCNVTSDPVTGGLSGFTVAGNIPTGKASCTVAFDVTTYIPPEHLEDDEVADLFDPREPEFAFPIDLTNTVAAEADPNMGLVGTAAATLRLEVPTIKVDIGAPALATNIDDSIQVSWPVTVLNATNMQADGSFCGPDICADKQVTLEAGATVTPTLGPSLTSAAWNVAIDSGSTSGSDWVLPDLAPGQAVQANVTAQITTLAEADFFMPVQIGDKLVLNGGPVSKGVLQNEILLNVADIPIADVPPAVNEAADDSVFDATWNNLWAQAQQSVLPWPAIADVTRLKSTAVDSDRWDRMQTQLAPSAIDVKAKQSDEAVLGSGDVNYQMTVTNVGTTLLTNVTLCHPAAADQTVCDVEGVPLCTIETLLPGESRDCPGIYNVSGDEMKDRWNPSPGWSEGIWADPASGDKAAGPYLHLRVLALGTPEYLNPDGSYWTYPDSHLTQHDGSPEAPLTVRSTATLEIPVFTIGELPYSGEEKRFPYEIVGAAILVLGAAAFRFIRLNNSRTESSTSKVRKNVVVPGR